MKVKNIMFSGVMAAILGATGANAAINVASQGYVDSKVDAVTTNITNNYLTKTDAENTYLTETQVTQQITNIVGTSDEGLLADVAANKAAVAELKTDKADKTAVEAITNSLTNYATTKALNGVKATAEAAATKTYVDTEFAKYTTTEALNTKLDDYAKQVDLDAEVTARGAAVKAVDDKLADYTKTEGLDAGFVSEAEMTAFKNANTEAINAKVSQSDYNTKVAALEEKDTELVNELATKITAPAACETQDCVLSINKATGTIAWVPLTEPVANYLNQ